MRDTPVPAPVPIQERLFELFGDEKALDRYSKTRPFTTGALDPDTLVCFVLCRPFVSQFVHGKSGKDR